MEEYEKIYNTYIQKSDDELRKIISPNSGSSRTAIEVAWDILCYERKVDDLGYKDLDDLLKHCSASSAEATGTVRKTKRIDLNQHSRNDDKIVEIFQKMGVLILLVAIYPLGMIFLWKNKKFDKRFKVIESVSCFVLWILLIGVAVGKINHMSDLKNEKVAGHTESHDVKTEFYQIETDMEQDVVEDEIMQEGKKTAKNESIQRETETLMLESTEISTEQSDVAGVAEREVSNLLFDGTNIIDLTITDMKQYDYITDVAIEVDENSKDINIAIQVVSSIDEDAAKMAGEDVSRYLAFCASLANSYYSTPGSTDIGGIYKTYNLLLYVDDGTGTFNMYGAKAKTANSITWQ